MFRKMNNHIKTFKGEEVTLVKVKFVFTENISCYIDFWVNEKQCSKNFRDLKRKCAFFNAHIEQNEKYYKLSNHAYIECIPIVKGIMKQDVDWEYYQDSIVRDLIELNNTK